MTIHSGHPFQSPDGDRNVVRSFRGRLPAAVTVWTTGQGRDRRGLTVSSLLIADGNPSKVAGLIDEDSDFWDGGASTFVVNVLTTGHHMMADAFAGIGPAPGGPFTLAEWDEGRWGPVLADNAGWIGARLLPGEQHHLGWGVLVEAVIEHIEVGDAEALSHLRGRYR